MFKSLVDDVSEKVYNHMMVDWVAHKPRPVMHASLQNFVFDLGKEYKFFPQSEFTGSAGGRIDVVWFHKDDSKKPYVIFEIDSSIRKNSFHKLCDQDAEIKFWILYPRKEPNPYAVSNCERKHGLIIIYPEKFSERFPE